MSADSTAVHEGDVIAGRYRVTGVLGRGGFGAVYAAEHTGTHQKMALKMLLSSGDADDGEVRRFYREAQITANLRHPNTVRVFDVGQTDAGALYIAMELLSGLSLEQELRERARNGQVFDERETLKIAIPVLKALQEAHGQKLVHRDLKPANIMLADSGDDELVVKVLDFGIAHAHDSSLTGAGTALGTPAYMSPEQCAGAELDGRSDLYSLGIILYRCVTGQPPFTDRNPLTLMYSHANLEPPDARALARVSLSDAFMAALNRSLAKKREDRFDSARDMRVALEAILAPPWTEPRPALSTGARTANQTRVVFADAGVAHDVDSETMAGWAVGESDKTQASELASSVVLAALPEPATALGPTVLIDQATVVAQPGSAVASAAPLARPTAKPSSTRLLLGAGAVLAVVVAIGIAVGLGRQAAPSLAPAPAAPKVAAIAPIAAPSQDDAAVKAAVGQRLAVLSQEMQACYEMALKSSPDLQGKVKVRFVLGPGGAVSAVTQEGANLEFARCITERLLIARGFPQVSHPVEFAQSYVFSVAPPVAPLVAHPVATVAPVPAPAQVKPPEPRSDSPQRALPIRQPKAPGRKTDGDKPKSPGAKHGSDPQEFIPE